MKDFYQMLYIDRFCNMFVHPRTSAFPTSVAKAFAVRAMIERFLASTLLRDLDTLIASYPFITGICISISIACNPLPQTIQTFQWFRLSFSTNRLHTFHLKEFWSRYLNEFRSLSSARSTFYLLISIVLFFRRCSYI